MTPPPADDSSPHAPLEAAAAERRFSHALALHRLGRTADAEAIYRELLQADPAHARCLNMLGILHSARADHAQALGLLDQAVALDPSPTHHSNRGNIRLALGNLEDALSDYDTALGLRPGFAQAHANRGVTLERLGRLEDAIAAYDRAVALEPDNAEAWYGRANAFKDLDQVGPAVSSYARVVTLRPDHGKAWCRLGIGQGDLWQLDEAMRSLRRAIDLDPRDAEAHCSLGSALHRSGRIDEAIRAYAEAIALKPDYVAAWLNQSLALLLAGDMARGWPAYEWRWQHRSLAADVRHFAQPRWQRPAGVEGRTVLLYAEQGFGDTIQFCRYVQTVAALGAAVVLEVQPALLGLMRGLPGARQVLPRGAPLPDFDLQCPLLSLPLALGTRLETIPAPQAYLRADPAQVAVWRGRLGAVKGLRVGIAWSGSRGHSNDRNRSLQLSGLLPHLPEGCEVISLQKDVRDTDAQTLERSPRVRHFGEGLRDFSDTAALCECMDVVISVDTSVAHLAGALGRPTWVLLPTPPDWRWLLGRDDSPWYPSARLYRRPLGAGWEAVLPRLGADLQALAGARALSAPASSQPPAC